jgi:preprotein translocase subunit SecD
MKWMTVLSILLSTCVFASDVSVVQSVLEFKDMKAAIVREEKGVTLLEIELTEGGARKIGAYSARHVGEVLSIVVDQHVVMSPTIRVPIVGNRLSVSALNPAEAEQIAAVINQKGQKR